MPDAGLFSKLLRVLFGSSRRLSLSFAVLALLCIPFADLVIYQVEPWQEFSRMGQGILSPVFPEFSILLSAVGHTLAFALIAVAGAALLGIGLAFIFHLRIVRIFSASIRAVHELFWGLIFMQLYGLSATTGVLAILIPFTGIFAKVFAEILEQQSPAPGSTLSVKTDLVSRTFYTWLPQAWPQLVSYTRYRFECALRSSTILGFIGLPTLGFYLETAFKQGQYSEAAALLLTFFILIASLRWWLHHRLLPVWVLLPGYLALAFYALPESPQVFGSTFIQFFTEDIWPRTVLAQDWGGALQWYQTQLFEVAIPALWDTLLLSQLALVLTGVLVLMLYPWASRAFFDGKLSFIRIAGRAALLVLRSIPEMIFAFVFLLLFGPSGIPAVIALALHNGGLISYLLSRQSDRLDFRSDSPTGLNRYFYEATPRLYQAFLALLLYRWEVIIRESAILGILGITTLGFYIDSAFEDIRYDRAAFLIIVAALLNIAVDALARRLRKSASERF